MHKQQAPAPKATVLPSSGMMHVWLMPFATVRGEKMVALRLVNADKDKSYDADHKGVEHDVPFFHVPSVKFPFGRMKTPPSVEETKKRAMPLVEKEWPALAKAKIVDADQELTGVWGGRPLFDGKRYSDPVTRILLDLGHLEKPPEIIHKPSERPSWLRHPIVWMRAKDIFKLAKKPFVHHGKQVSRYYTPERTIKMEAKSADDTIMMQETQTKDVVFQNSVASMYDKNGISFTTVDRPPPASPSIKRGSMTPL
jgi:hypothetical protein